MQVTQLETVLDQRIMLPPEVVEAATTPITGLVVLQPLVGIQHIQDQILRVEVRTPIQGLPQLEVVEVHTLDHRVALQEVVAQDHLVVVEVQAEDNFKNTLFYFI